MYMVSEALDDAAAQPATSLDDDGDPTIELERHELAALLDRALALLPPETRLALVQHYIEESSHAAIAARLGLSEGGVAVRLHRGKLAFRHGNRCAGRRNTMFAPTASTIVMLVGAIRWRSSIYRV